MQEVWKDVKGYEGLYQVSNCGRVKVLTRRIGSRYHYEAKIMKVNKILTPCKKDNNYLYVSLTKNRKRSNKYIHRLVAEAFIPREAGENIVNHKDYNVTNNNVNNLEWVTQKENVKHSICNMQHPKVSTRKTATGFKYIGKKGNRYRVYISSAKHGCYDKTFEDLETAISKRNEVLELWQIVYYNGKRNVI